MSAPTIRPATEADLPAVQAIYAHHVLHGLASFEEVPPTLQEMTARFHGVVDKGLPYVVAEGDGEILGYAYAGLYRPRVAYRFAVENSVYVKAGLQARGIGLAAMTAVIADCTVKGYRQMIAVIGDSGNTGSIRLHERLGFLRTGLLPSCGWKFGRWVDSVLMQRALGPGDTAPP